ncbi:MAG: metal ABC transporter substrate-binding protein [Christensenellales bacterium]|jgi:ABC-type Zn uptake system ZnuABC Zn-binding protein ZnuA
MKNTMKKALVFALSLSLVLGLSPLSHSESRKLRLVATVFPQYDWLRNILGERMNEVELTLLQDSGVDLHNFQPSARDIMKVSSADLFVYIGGPSDKWVDDALSQAVNREMVAVNLMQALGDAVKADVTIEGMQETAHAHDHDEHDHGHEEEQGHEKEHENAHDHEEEHEHEHEDAHDHEEEHGHDKHEGHEHAHEDEHIWLSLRNAQALIPVLTDALSRLDPEHAASYQANAAIYIEKLKALDEAFQAAVDGATVKTLLFADRFPFRYLMDDYGLQYFAAFSGCSAETEASFETVTFLSGKVDELGLKNVLVLEGADKTLASTIVNNTKAKDQAVVVFDSMQSVDQAALKRGVTYLSIMEHNLQALKTALN